MIDADYCSSMAEYNQWMNTRLFELCALIPEIELNKDQGAFFKSIHSTLDHIMYGDLAFMHRFTGEPSIVPQLGEPVYNDFHKLREARLALDIRILNWSASLSKQWLEKQLTYKSQVDGVTRTIPQWVLVTHMFNHETHHRGQITTLLSQMGFDIGSTDIPFMPIFQQ